MNTSESTIQVYVACLASYNAGRMFGEWLDADQDAGDLRAEIADLLRRSPCPNVEVTCPDCEGETTYMDQHGNTLDCFKCNATGKVPSAEEWAIHDYNGFGGAAMGENPDLDKLTESAKMIAEHGEAWTAYCGHVGADYATAEGFQESYQGEHRSEEDFAESFADDTGMLSEVPENLRCYFDFEKFARDLFCGDYAYIDGHVFSCH